MNYIELAKQAGFVVDQDAQKYQPQCIEATHRMIDEPLKIFAALVAAHEREECAKIAEIAEPYQAADLIRARGTT